MMIRQAIKTFLDNFVMAYKPDLYSSKIVYEEKIQKLDHEVELQRRVLSGSLEFGEWLKSKNVEYINEIQQLKAEIAQLKAGEK